MRVFKPLQLSLQYKTFEWLGRHQLSVSLLLGFPFDSRQEVLMEQDLWQFLPAQMGSDGILDYCMPKPQGEVLVYGNYYSPGGQPVTADTVQFNIGAVNKTLSVIGDRYWRAIATPGVPESFNTMPVTYEYAFGGIEYKANPVGKGIDEVDVFGEMRIPMPNIENPDWLVTSKSQRPDPAGFAPLDMMWQYRASKMGTYDEIWQREYFPGYPPDLDWTHFNEAPEDQWIDGFWQGDEEFSLTNMHPSKAELEGSLPAFRTRCFIQKKQAEAVLFTEVEMRTETVFLFPEAETGIVIYRGVIEVAEDDASDVSMLLAGYEDLDQALRSKEYYEKALSNRLDDKTQFKYIMSTTDIIADSERCGFIRLLDAVDTETKSAFSENINTKVVLEKQKLDESLELQKQQIEKLTGKLQMAGINTTPVIELLKPDRQPDEDPEIQELMKVIEKILPGSTQNDVGKVDIQGIDFSKFDEFNEKVNTLVAKKKKQVIQQLEQLQEKAKGTRAEQQVNEQVKASISQMNEKQPLPRPVMDEALKNLQDSLISIEQTKKQLREQGVAEDKLPKVEISFEKLEKKQLVAQAEIKKMYRSGAHLIEGKLPHKDPVDIIQYRMQKSLDKGESLAGKDLAGVDFSGKDLSGMDLSDCFLEYTDFSGCNLQGANLQRTVITHANLQKANLTDADCRDSNFGDSIFEGSNLTRTKLNNCEFSKASLKGAQVIDCDLKDVNFLQTTMTGVDFSGSIFKAANFLNLDFSAGRFVGSQMIECNFLQCTLTNTDFTSAYLTGSNFIECNLDYSTFIEANMTNVRFPGGCSLKSCNFDHANLDKSNLRDTEAQGSRFEFSSFHQADFSGANLQNTRFYGAEGKRAMLMKTDLSNADFSSVNLMEGSMLKARLINSDLRYSNFYAVEFLNATIGGTDFTGANLDLTKLQDWRPDRDT